MNAPARSLHGSRPTAAPLASEAFPLAHASFATADGALAVLAFAANQAIAGQVAFAHAMGDLALAQAREIAAAGERSLPQGALRDAVVSLANLEARCARGVIDSANRFGRSFAHLAFAFPVPSRG